MMTEQQQRMMSAVYAYGQELTAQLQRLGIVVSRGASPDEQRAVLADVEHTLRNRLTSLLLVIVFPDDTGER